MSSITSTGLGSGLDINSIVSAIVDAERDPALASMVAEEQEATEKISAYGTLNSELSSFKDSYSDLSRSSTFSAATASSSDDSILSATPGIGAATGNWSFEVQQLAQAQTIVSSSTNSYSAATSEVGTGTITFSYGTYGVDENGGDIFTENPEQAAETLTIDATNNSLDKMRDAINEGDYSVSASIVNDGSNYRLILTNKETGAENAVQITVADDDGNSGDTSGLSSLTYSADVKHMEQTSTALDAVIVMNGIEVTRSSNDISDVIEGVTLNLEGETEIGKTVSLTITSDISVVEEQLNAFVESYNNTINQMNALTLDGGDSGEDGALNGDSTVRNIRNQMRSLLNTSLSHLDGSIKSFADLGILTTTDGTLEIDSTPLINEDGSTSSHTRFSNALANHMDDVESFFTASGTATDELISFESNSSLTVPGTYDIEVTALATQGILSGGAYTIPVTLDSTNNTFQMRLDGFSSENISLSAGTYDTFKDLATELEKQINADPNFIENGLNVSILEYIDISGVRSIGIQSNSYGSSSTVAITETTIDGNTLNSLLGLSVGGGTSGVNAEGMIDGKAAYGDGQLLLSQYGDSTGIQVLIDGGELGDRGTVTYSEGMSTMLNDLLDGLIDTNISASDADIESGGGILDGKIDAMYSKIADLEEEEETLTYRMDLLEERLYTEYNAMDIAVSNFNSTMSYLEATLDALPGYANE